MRRYGEKAGITGKRVSPHTLRHTFGFSWGQRKNANILHLQKVMGHKTLAMTMRCPRTGSEDAFGEQEESNPIAAWGVESRLDAAEDKGNGQRARRKV
jgi:integrase/recombinase XerD